MVTAMVIIHLANGIAIGLFPVVGTWGVAAARMFFAGVVLTIFVRPKVSLWTREQWLATAGLGLSLGFMIGLYYVAIDYIPVGTAVALLFLGPLALGAVMSRSARDFAGVGLAFIALGFIALDSVTGTSLHPLGVAVALASAACWSCYIVAGKRATTLIRGLDSLAVAFLIAGAAMLPFARGAVALYFTDLDVFGMGLLVAMIGSLIPFSLDMLALRRLPANIYAVLTSLEPCVAALIAWWTLDQSVSLLKGIGIGFVVAASVVQSMAPPRGIQRRLTTVARVGREHTRRAGRGARISSARVLRGIASRVKRPPRAAARLRIKRIPAPPTKES